MDFRRDYARLIHSAAFRRLQGKTQLFPNHESDFFRNRLTHSLEVAQIAKSIANKLNHDHSEFHGTAIDTDLVETAALAHDLGHPPFGHNGEEALDECMAPYGGFEGNAQTLRILSKLEKKRTRSAEEPFPVVDGHDERVGLNLTFRTLAATLKYDQVIPRERIPRREGDIRKGYYYTEKAIVKELKKKILGGPTPKGKPFRTLECSIMDVADDIAYSTYDLEDAFKGGFLMPISMVSAPSTLLAAIADTVTDRLKKFYGDDHSARDLEFKEQDVRDVLLKIFGHLFELPEEEIQRLCAISPKTSEFLNNVDLKAFLFARAFDTSRQLANVGYRRTEITSELVGRFIRGVEFFRNRECLPLSKVRLAIGTFKEVETLKVFAFESLIQSSMLKLAEHSGKDIVKGIFNKIYNKQNDKGYMLLPEDFRQLYCDLGEPAEKARVVCDFIAGMTDRYAIDFYSRLTSPNASNIWKPL